MARDSIDTKGSGGKGGRGEEAGMIELKQGKGAPRVAGGAPPPPPEARSPVVEPTSRSLVEKARDSSHPGATGGGPLSGVGFKAVMAVLCVGLMAWSAPCVAKAYEDERAAFDPREGPAYFHWTPFGGMIAGHEFGQRTAIVMVLIQAVLYVTVLGLTWKYRPDAPSPYLKKWLFVHNVVMSSFSGLIVVACLIEMYRSSSPSDLWSCSTVDSKAYDVIQMVWVGSKPYEWLDTVFLLLQHKRPIFLHLFHHFTTTAIFLLATQHSAVSKIFLLFNGSIHFVMYGHYARPFPPAWRRWITRGQIIQFVVGGAWFAFAAPKCYGDLDKKMFSITLEYAMIGSLLLLFSHFYVNDAKRRKARSLKGKSGAPATANANQAPAGAIQNQLEFLKRDVANLHDRLEHLLNKCKGKLE